uniref:Nkap_C domain-containing protein n=1 Tax=Haemonchus contortus TaxID=6289 RepID=A0A7I4YAR6_HAECO
MTDKNDIGWMYEGAKSLVNREDYLLGKKVDKNFEKYSDAVNEQKPDAFDALLHTRTVFKPQPSSTKTSALESYVVATEDPLVAVKVKEETRRREVLENPLVKFKFQKMLKEMMAQKEAKGDKKKKKKKKKAKDGGKEKKEKKKKKSRSSSEKNSSAKGSPKRRDSRSERARNGSDIASDTERESRRKHRSSDRTVKAVVHSKSPVHQDRNRSHRSRSRHKERKTHRSRSSSSTVLDREREKSLSPTRNGSKLGRERRRGDSSSSSDESRRYSSKRNDRSHKRSASRERRKKSGPSQAMRMRDPSPTSRQSQSTQKRRRSSSSVSPKRKRRSKSPTTRTRRSRERRSERSRNRNSSSSSTSSSSSSSSPATSRNHRRTPTKECGERNHHSTSAEPSQADTEKPQKTEVHESEDPCTSKEERKDSKQIRAFDSHIPEHLRPKNFASDNDDDTEDEFDRREREHKKRFEGFGLVGVKEKEKHEESGPTENPYELSRKPALPVYQKPERRRPLTEEEKQAKLREMSENAAWRQSARNSNLKRAQLADEKEDEEDMRDKAPSFIRSQLNSAASDLTVEHRLQSNKKSLQRSHGFMEKKFTSK